MEAKEKFDILLAKFKQAGNSQEAMDNVIFVLDPKENLPKALIAWKNIEVTLDFSNPKDTKDDWEYIWQFARYNNDKFAFILGVKKGEAVNLVKQLKTLKYVYPDGTVSSVANGVVRAMIKQSIEKTTGQKVGGKSEAAH